jgi:hypothetical protein
MQTRRRSQVFISALTVMAVMVMPSVALGVTDPADPLNFPEQGAEGRGTFFYDADNDRYYEVVLYGQGDDRTWPTARIAAAARTIHSGAFRGYLATIPSQSDNAFVVNTIGDGYDFYGLWIGASDDEIEGEWFWVTGPNAGLQFWSGGPDGSAPSGVFSAWQELEPNNKPTLPAGAENFGVANYCIVTSCTPTRSWNDAAGATAEFVPGYVTGYLVAYAPVPAGIPAGPQVSMFVLATPLLALFAVTLLMVRRQARQQG